jgi:hypothetical protein
MDQLLFPREAGKHIPALCMAVQLLLFLGDENRDDNHGQNHDDPIRPDDRRTQMRYPQTPVTYPLPKQS